LWIIAPLDPEAAGHPTDLPEDIAAAVRSGRASRQDERVVPVAANLILLSGGDVAGGQNQIVEAGRRVSNRLLKARATAVGQACCCSRRLTSGNPCAAGSVPATASPAASAMAVRRSTVSAARARGSWR